MEFINAVAAAAAEEEEEALLGINTYIMSLAD